MTFIFEKLQKVISQIFFVVAILKVTTKKSRIQIHYSEVRIRGFPTLPAARKKNFQEFQL
jgi:hypothetical protein